MIAESKFLQTASRVSQFVISAIKKSRSFGYFNSFITFILSAFSGAASVRIFKTLPRFYPGAVWRAFDSLNTRVKSRDIFNPVIIFPLVYLSFISVSTYRVSNLAIFSVLLGIVFFILGAAVSGRLRFRKLALDDSSERIVVALLTIGVVSLIYDVFQTGSLPLLDSLARRKLNVTLTMLASVLVPGGIIAVSLVGQKFREGFLSQREARMYALGAMLLTTLLISLLGYRTQIIVALLGCTIAMYYRRLLGISEILLAFFSLMLAVSALGYYRAISEGSTVGFLDVIGRRVGLTLSIYDNLINRFWFAGANKGTVFLATFSSFLPFIPGPGLGPRTIVARMFGVTGISMTSTLLGTVVLDFGIPGIVFFTLVLGFVVGTAYNAMKQTESTIATGLFALLMAYTLVGIETGLVDFNVFTFFAVSFLILFSRAS
ncbi:MAG: oligosaccharide repeat unit polymerase [Candidatus Hydrothermarchaeaceae archaeon]